MKCGMWRVESGVAENVARTVKRKKLESKIRKEEQFNRQMEVNAELRKEFEIYG